MEKHDQASKGTGSSKKKISFLKGIQIKVLQVLLKNVDHRDNYFGLGHDIALSAEAIPVYID